MNITKIIVTRTPMKLGLQWPDIIFLQTDIQHPGDKSQFQTFNTYSYPDNTINWIKEYFPKVWWEIYIMGETKPFMVSDRSPKINLLEEPDETK